MQHLPKMTLALAAAFILNLFITLEWTMERCGKATDGPVYAVYGLIPYRQFSGVSSLQYDYIPWAYALNMLLLSLPFVLASLLLKWKPSMLWLFLALPIISFSVFVHSLFLVFPVSSFRDDIGDVSITDLSLVGVTTQGDYDCTPLLKG